MFSIIFFCSLFVICIQPCISFSVTTCTFYSKSQKLIRHIRDTEPITHVSLIAKLNSTIDLDFWHLKNIVWNDGVVWFVTHALVDDNLFNQDGQIIVELTSKQGIDNVVFNMNGANQENRPILVIGDTLLSSLAQAGGHNPYTFHQTGHFGAVIHLGDFVYAFNDGRCYGRESDPKCQWNTADTSHLAARFQSTSREKWVNWIQSYSWAFSFPWGTTEGNHDADMTWNALFSPRPQNLSIESFVRRPNIEPLKWTYGSNITFISYVTEDNRNNQYEMNKNDGELLEEAQRRFDNHYGTKSLHYRYLESLLKNATRPIVVFSHRSLFHSSHHHATCTSQGDWFGCAYRELYHALFVSQGVSAVISGHIHQYEHSIQNNIHYIVQGNGGFQLDSGQYGFGVLHTNGTYVSRSMTPNQEIIDQFQIF